MRNKILFTLYGLVLFATGYFLGQSTDKPNVACIDKIITVHDTVKYSITGKTGINIPNQTTRPITIKDTGTFKVNGSYVKVAPSFTFVSRLSDGLLQDNGKIYMYNSDSNRITIVDTNRLILYSDNDNMVYTADRNGKLRLKPIYKFKFDNDTIIMPSRIFTVDDSIIKSEYKLKYRIESFGIIKSFDYNLDYHQKIEQTTVNVPVKRPLQVVAYAYTNNFNNVGIGLLGLYKRTLIGGGIDNHKQYQIIAGYKF